ncbi:hypothetical protein FG184_09285 [Campylobacter upsaliensis]|nr:hypothetical protein [Campylobacter upsaliensis]
MQENIEKNSKLANFPIVLFASVMGIGGLSLVFKKASVAFNHQAFLACTFICVLWCENTLLF